MLRRDMDRQLAALYEQVPSIPDCKGLCWLSCSPLDMSDRERERIAAAGFTITPGRQARALPVTYWCEALGPDGRCQVYDLRPMICRLWGTTRSLRCPHGCIPDGGWMPEEQFHHLMNLAYEAGGGGADAAGYAAIVRRLGQPGFLEQLTREHRGLNRGDWIRAAEYGAELPAEVTRRPLRRRARG